MPGCWRAHFTESYIWAGFRKRCPSPPGWPQEERPSSQQPMVWKSRALEGVRRGQGPAVSSKAGHSGWGQIAKYEYPAKTLGLYSVSREWMRRSMLDAVGKDKWSGGGWEPGHRQKLYDIWGVKRDAKDSILARMRRMRYTSPHLQPMGKQMGSPVLVLWFQLTLPCRGHRTLDLPAWASPSRLGGWTRHWHVEPGVEDHEPSHSGRPSLN